ncbi:MAG: cupin domain-containing protein [Rhodobacterales bacterium]|nr:cupin domain-containing protein [Rhodobacterales bacterium]
MITGTLKVFAVALFFASSAVAQEPIITSLFETDLPDLPDREGLMASVELPPGASMPAHRHDANTFVYVLSGSVVMQVKGGERTVLNAGGTFYESPDSIHTVTMNESNTDPARLLVVFIKHKGAPVTEYTQ